MQWLLSFSIFQKWLYCRILLSLALYGIIGVGFTGTLLAQPGCHTDEYRATYYMGMDRKEAEAETAYMRDMIQPRAGSRSTPIVYLPIVFHVILPDIGQIQAPDSAMIAAKLDLINSVLRGESLCPNDPLGTDTRIQLCMAQRMPDMSPTTAVLTYNHALSELDLCTQDLELKTFVNTPFSTESHINVYLVEQICSSCSALGCEIGGYATYAPDHGTPTDGIVIRRRLFLSDDCQDLKVFIHELGHYANLLHTFHQGCQNTQCLEDGDRVCDTPPSRDQYGLPSHPCLRDEQSNSCNTDVNPADPNNPFSSDQADLSDNFMSYAPLSCMYRFTPGQVERMHSAINHLRNGLLSSRACEPPCLNPMQWDIELPDTIYAGEGFIPINRSDGASDFRWILEQTDYQGMSPIITADTSGTYQLLVIPVGLPAHCTDTLRITVEVGCRIPEILYSISATQIEYGQHIDMALIDPQPGIRYTWMVNEKAYNSADQVQWSSDIEGYYTVYVLACNDYCCVRSAAEYIQMGACQEKTPGKTWLVGSRIKMTFEDDGQISVDSSAHFSYECMAMAFGEQGELLFASEGIFLYNRDILRMVNSIGLGGHTSSSQALALRQPGSRHIWYLFTPHAYQSINENPQDFPLHYSIIDMRLDGGRGAVIAKRQLLFMGSTEKITAVRHCNGADWWIITHEAANDRFRIYTLDAHGLKLDPIIQDIGYFYESSPLCVAGYLRPSPNGRLIASTKYPTGSNTFDSGLEIFRFNPTTGVLSEPLHLEDSRRLTYGVEFSPNGEYLYSHDDDKIYQYHLVPYDVDSIIASKRYLGSTLVTQTGALCRGPDDVIYVSNNGDYLSAIFDADTDSARLVINHILGPNGQRFSIGLPNFPNDLYRDYRFRISGPKEVCDTVSMVRFEILEWCTPVDYQVEVPEGVVLIKQDSTGFDLQIERIGDYEFYVHRETGCQSLIDTLYLQVNSCDTSCQPILELVAGDTLICRGQTAYVQVSSNVDTLWLQSDTEPNPVPISPGILSLGRPDTNTCYTIRAEEQMGCDTSIQFCIKVQEELTFEILQMDTLICSGELAEIHLVTDAGWVEIISADQSYSYVNPQFPLSLGPIYADSCYTIRAIDTIKGCDTLFQLCIRVQPLPDIADLQLQDQVCGDSASFSLDFDAQAIRYQWISADDGMVIAEDFALPWEWDDPGNYILRLQGLCSRDIPIQATKLSLPTYSWIDLPQSVCAGDTVVARLDTDAAQVFILQSDIEIEIDPQQIRWEGVLGDTCTLFRLINSQGCITELSVCIEVDTQNLLVHEPILLCPGDSAWVFDRHVYVPGVFNRTIPQEPGCDLLEMQEVILYPPIVYQILSRSTCLDAADGWIEISPETGTMPFDILWSHESSTSMLLSGLSEGMYPFTITDAVGCTHSDAIEIQSILLPMPDIVLQDPGCDDPTGGLIELNNTNQSYQYNIGGSPYIEGRTYAAGSYLLRIADSQGCSRDTMLELQVEIPPLLTMPPDMTITKGSTITLRPQVSGSGTYRFQWSPVEGLSCINCLEPILTITRSMYYVLQVISDSDCQVTDTLWIEVPEPTDGIFIPDAFTPNGDGINDVFEVFFGDSNFQVLNLNIYNRWGSEVYRCQGLPCKWDGTFQGKDLNPALYFYQMTILTPDGEQIIRSGEVSLLK